jgi:hypothetical protein
MEYKCDTVRDDRRPACGSAAAPLLDQDLFKVLDQLQYALTNRNRSPLVQGCSPLSNIATHLAKFPEIQ